MLAVLRLDGNLPDAQRDQSPPTRNAHLAFDILRPAGSEVPGKASSHRGRVVGPTAEKKPLATAPHAQNGCSKRRPVHPRTRSSTGSDPLGMKFANCESLRRLSQFPARALQFSA